MHRGDCILIQFNAGKIVPKKNVNFCLLVIARRNLKPHKLPQQKKQKKKVSCDIFLMTSQKY